ncbi:hypothetical protein JOC85_002519 [Bacillus mesophilus]|uniref:Uncharacterized protein n=1 Tax=Bacillus mesophilus TaxID=1808955 RepID=A0A6M0Q7P4_9BACI|nr:hypothetical protein [Bacillus mesophilus]MBM7661716.1 hypothetical protein [Bacillus mesophilus]NEY72376.1 hypothetical protein [Bacillus mesophilus]
MDQNKLAQQTLEFELTIKINKEKNTLFELGYISLDILQLVVLGELIEQEKTEKAEDIFLKKKPYGYFTRDSLFLREYKERAIIKELRKGSIILVISGISATAAIINLIVQHKVRKNTHKNETIYFEVSSNDDRLNDLLESYDNGNYGKGGEGFKWLNKQLLQMGYSVRLKDKDAYIIEKVSEEYKNRIIKTIKKY